jgi:DNA-binding CsgD family transcriptional regulator
MLRALGGPDGVTRPIDEWTMDWLVPTADTLVGQAPGVAAELLTRAVASAPACSARHGWLASRLADALYRTGERVKAEQVVIRALEYPADPDHLVDLHWTLAQCRMLAGSSAESLATLDRALASPGISSLTPAEITIAAFVGEGLSNPQIAARLLLSRSTVATHVCHILNKLDVHSRIDIARESALRTLGPR